MRVDALEPQRAPDAGATALGCAMITLPFVVAVIVTAGGVIGLIVTL